jgi:hypothetical protein
MELEVSPPLPDEQLGALRTALATVAPAAASNDRPSAWWREGVREAVDWRPEAYAPSPRSTRGATRA